MRALVSSENAKVVRERLTDVCPRCCLILRLGLLRCSFFFTAQDFWRSFWRNKAVAVVLLGFEVFDKRIDAEVEDDRRESVSLDGTNTNRDRVCGPPFCPRLRRESAVEIGDVGDDRLGNTDALENVFNEVMRERAERVFEVERGQVQSSGF